MIISENVMKLKSLARSCVIIILIIKFPKRQTLLAVGVKQGQTENVLSRNLKKNCKKRALEFSLMESSTGKVQ